MVLNHLIGWHMAVERARFQALQSHRTLLVVVVSNYVEIFNSNLGG